MRDIIAKSYLFISHGIEVKRGKGLFMPDAPFIIKVR